MAFTFKLEHPDGTPVDPPTLKSAVPNWRSAIRSRLAPVSLRCWSWGSATRANPNTTHFSSSRPTFRFDGRGPRVRSVRS
jgi:hypothetical protein